MRVVFLIKIVFCIYTDNISYEMIDKFIELNDEKIPSKRLGYALHIRPLAEGTFGALGC